MKSNSSIITILIFLHLCGFAFAAINKAWIDRSAGLTEGKVNCLYVGGNSRTFLLAGTDKALYRSDSTRRTFQPVLQLYGNFKTINQIQNDVSDTATLYSATDAGVFVSQDQGLTWENIFSPSSALARKVFCVLADRGNVYAGTADGLYVRTVGEVTWKKEAHELGKSIVFHLADAGEFIYAATANEVYRLEKNTGELKKVFAAIDRHDEEQEFDDEGEPIRQSLVKDLVSVNNGKQVFAVIGRELLVTEDQGESWDNWITENLPVEFVRRLFVNERMVAATEKGIFFFENDRWENDVTGLTSNFVNDVAIDTNGDVFLATLNGVFAKDTGEDVAANINYDDISQYFKTEPTIKDVQKMAIEYANVNPTQIKSWHNQSRTKALLPSLSVGLNRADTDLVHWDTGPNPDVLTKGRDFLDWSTTVSWDFSDLVWSSDRTAIDSRAKMMSELRQDILDQVTRLYFERRRIQIELVSLKESDWDREMRVEELTALLDSFTGGEFSRRAQKDSPVKKW
jgi:hypothetical protein